MANRFNKKDMTKLLIFGASLICVATLIPSSLNPIKRVQNLKEMRDRLKINNKANLNRIAILGHGNLAKSFHKKLYVSDESDSLIYGNAEIGYFKTKDKFKDSIGTGFEYLPPTYLSKLEFCVEDKKGNLKTVQTKKLEAPKVPILENFGITKEGEFSDPFYLIGAAFIPTTGNLRDRTYFPVIINRFGEIVWAHLTQHGKLNFRRYLMVKPVGDGLYGVLYGEKSSFFEKFNSKGEIDFSINPKLSDNPYVIHHDFVYHSNRLFTLGHKLHYLRNIYPLIDDTQHWLQFFTPPSTVVSTTLEEVNIGKNSSKILWDPIDSFNILKGVNWERTPAHANFALLNLGRHFSEFDKPEAQIDFSHANTLEYYPGLGYLISLRNLSKVVLLDEKFNLVWTLGNDPEDTYQTKNLQHAFYHQHHAQILPSGYVLMMDNHSSPPAPNNIGSRVVVYGFDKEKGKAVVVWNYQPPHYLKIFNRGSAYMMGNRNVLAYYPASINQQDHMIEVDRETGKAVGHMKIYFSKYQIQVRSKNPKKNEKVPVWVTEGGGNRAIPLQKIGKEKRLVGFNGCPI
ncbi:MAG: aryl-sulfate sulfotransferase [Bacteriovoracaceae bacterium]